MKKTLSNLKAFVIHMTGTRKNDSAKRSNITFSKICHEPLFIYLQCLFTYLPLELSSHSKTVVGRKSCECTMSNCFYCSFAANAQ